MSCNLKDLSAAFIGHAIAIWKDVITLPFMYITPMSSYIKKCLLFLLQYFGPQQLCHTFPVCNHSNIEKEYSHMACINLPIVIIIPWVHNAIFKQITTNTNN